MKLYKKVLSYLGGMKLLIPLGALLSGVGAVFTLYAYRNIDLLFKELIINNNIREVEFFAKSIFITMALGYAIYFLATFITHIAAFRLETALRKKGLKGLSKATASFYDKYPSGKVRKIIDDNAAQTHMAVAHLVPDLMGGIITPIGIIVLGYIVDIKAGIVISIITVLSLILLNKMMGNADFLKKYQEYLEELSAETVEYVRGMQVVKIFGTGPESFKNFRQCIKDYSVFALKYSMSCKWPYTIFQLIFFAILTVLIPIWIFFGRFGDSKEEASVILIMILFLSGVFFVSFMKIMYLGMHMQLADIAIKKLENLYSEMEESAFYYGHIMDFKNNNIEFKDINFSYGDKLVLSDFSLKLQEKKVYAFVGSSGSGKSTVAKLIAGLYKPNNGFVKIGGNDIFDYDEKALMKNIAFVFQNPILFKRSIYENVAIGNPEANREEVLNALSLAGCDDILDKFPDRENTIIGSRGVYLSGGEKQRITIARAMLKDAGIVILDEASGAIDPENEYEFQKAFSTLMEGKTVIMIAHRLSSIKGVDKIFVMENGEIVEEGSHLELMKENSRYKHYQTLYEKANDWRVENG